MSAIDKADITTLLTHVCYLDPGRRGDRADEYTWQNRPSSTRQNQPSSPRQKRPSSTRQNRPSSTRQNQPSSPRQKRPSSDVRAAN
jgi:hypothetical protein